MLPRVANLPREEFFNFCVLATNKQESVISLYSNKFDTPLFNIGTQKLPKWIRIEDGEIKKSDNPQEFVPQSHNKEKQIVTRQNNIYSSKQRI